MVFTGEGQSVTAGPLADAEIHARAVRGHNSSSSSPCPRIGELEEALFSALAAAHGASAQDRSPIAAGRRSTKPLPTCTENDW